MSDFGQEKALTILAGTKAPETAGAANVMSIGAWTIKCNSRQTGGLLYSGLRQRWLFQAMRGGFNVLKRPGQ